MVPGAQGREPDVSVPSYLPLAPRRLLFPPPACRGRSGKTRRPRDPDRFGGGHRVGDGERNADHGRLPHSTWRSSLIIAFAACYLMWFITFMAQLHPLIAPRRSDIRNGFQHE